MSDAINFEKKPRADSMKANADHNHWALHEFAFTYKTMPNKFANYHPDRVIDDDHRPGYYDDFIPVAHNSDRGQIIGKDVQYQTIHCPDCEVAARKVDGENVCPECGLICHQAGPSHEIIRDGKAAGRTDSC